MSMVDLVADFQEPEVLDQDHLRVYDGVLALVAWLSAVSGIDGLCGNPLISKTFTFFLDYIIILHIILICVTWHILCFFFWICAIHLICCPKHWTNFFLPLELCRLHHVWH